MSKTPTMGRLGIAWIAVVTLYSVGRAIAVGGTLGDYGVNPWIFLVLDVGSGIPLALGQVKLVQGLRARNPAMVQRWLAVMLVSFLTPYAYLVLGSDRPLPEAAYWIIGGLVLAMGVSTFWRIRTEARRAITTGGPGLPGVE